MKKTYIYLNFKRSKIPALKRIEISKRRHFLEETYSSDMTRIANLLGIHWKKSEFLSGRISKKKISLLNRKLKFWTASAYSPPERRDVLYTIEVIFSQKIEGRTKNVTDKSFWHVVAKNEKQAISKIKKIAKSLCRESFLPNGQTYKNKISSISIIYSSSADGEYLKRGAFAMDY